MKIDNNDVLALDVQSFVGKCTALLGITGSGKTNTAAVIIEELLESGLPMTIVDIEGEYYGLKERFEILVAGRSEHAEILIGPENAASLAQVSIERGISVILDLSGYTEDESHECLIEYFGALWQCASKVKRPYQIVLEEAHEWLPEGVRTPLKTLLTRIALRGRKRGLGIVLMSQRSAKVAKDVLTQASLLFLHRVVHPTDLKVYKDLIPLPGNEVEAFVGALQPGWVVAVSNHVPVVANIRMRYTYHAGSTPTFGENAQPDLRRIDETLLHELQSLIKATKKSNDTEETLKSRVKTLEALIAEKDSVIQRQAEQIEMLSQLSVSMPSTLHIEQASVSSVKVQHVDNVASRPMVIEAEAMKQLSAPINESKLRTLQLKLRQLNTRQRQIWNALVEHDEPMVLDLIAAYVGVSKETVRVNMLPDAFFKIGLVKRSRTGNAYVYKSQIRAYIAKEFPGVSHDEVFHRITENH